MNEFIVWDKNNNIFVEDREFYLSSKGILLTEYGKGNMVSIDAFVPFYYFGKDDIQGNKIYADCSIFEFWFNNGKERVFLRGVFTYNDLDLRYEVDILGDDKYVVLDFVPEYFTMIQIIDTIQENKLGLIKCSKYQQ